MVSHTLEFPIFRVGVILLVGVFLVLFSWAGLGMVFAYFVLPTPPAQCRGWSGKSAHSFVAHSHFSGVAGWVQEVLGVFLVVLLLVLPTPIWEQLGCDQGNINNTYWATRPSRLLCYHFFFPKTQTLSRPTHVAGDMAMAFVEDSFLPLKTKGYVSSFLADLPVQRCGSGI